MVGQAKEKMEDSRRTAAAGIATASTAPIYLV
jgi:hypothetical protein